MKSLLKDWSLRQDSGVRQGSLEGGQAGRMQAVKGRSMEKWLCYGAMGVAGLLLLLFLLDLIVGIPFQGVNATVDVVCILASGLVLYLAWETLKDWR